MSDTPRPGYSMLDIAIVTAYAPLVGVERRLPTVAHAVTAKHAIHGFDSTNHRTTVDAACGRRVAILAPLILWAPRVRGTSQSRCPDCEAIHGKRVPPLPRWMKAPTP